MTLQAGQVYRLRVSSGGRQLIVALLSPSHRVTSRLVNPWNVLILEDDILSSNDGSTHCFEMAHSEDWERIA